MTALKKSLLTVAALGFTAALIGRDVTPPWSGAETGAGDQGGLVAPAWAQANLPPVADGGFDRTVAAGDTVVLDGSGSTDPKGMVDDFAWSFIAKPALSGAVLDDPTAVKPSFIADLAGDYVVELVLSEGNRSSAPDRVTISTNNSAPVADAGADQAFVPGDTVTLDASGSSDFDGDALSYSWTLVTVPAGSMATLLNPTTLRPSFMPDVLGTYVAELVVSDATSSSASELVTVSSEGVAPVAEAGRDVSSFVGNRNKEQFDGSLSNDADGDQLAYDWKLISVPLLSAQELASQADVRPTLVVDKLGLYLLQLTITDASGEISRDTLTISTDNSPPVANAGPDRVVSALDMVELDAGGTTDVDGDLLSFRWALVSKPPTSTATLDDPASLRPSFEADVAGTYVAQLIVKDASEFSAPDTVVITTENARPVAEAGPAQSVATRQVVQLDATGSSDANSTDTLTFSWTVLEQPNGNKATISDPASPSPTFTFTKFGEHVLQVVVSDGALTAVDTVLFSTINSRPVAVPGPEQLVLPGDFVQLDGTGSGDVDSDPLAFFWAIIAKPEGSLAALSDPTSPTPAFTADLDLPGFYLVQLIVREASVANPLATPKASLPETVVVAAPNTPPVADAGPDQRVPIPQGRLVTLDGSASSDPDGDPLSFAWSFVLTPLGSTAALSDPGAVSPTFVADLAGAYVAQLVVNDGIVDSAPDSVTVTADANPPLADAGPDQSVTAGALVTLDGSLSSDPEGRPLSFSWRFLFTPHATPPGPPALSDATAVGPSFTADLTGLYIAELTVNDGVFDSQPASVAIRAGSAVGNSPPVLAAIGPRSVALGVTLTLDLTGSDPDGDQIFYRATPVPLPEGASLATLPGANPALDPNVGLFTFTPGPAQVGDLVLSFSVSDGLLSDSESVTITVTPPAPGTLTAFSARVLDADAFHLDQTELGVAGATVTLGGVSSTTAADGSFTLTGVAAGSGLLVIDTSTATPFPDPAPGGSAYAGLNETVALIADTLNQRAAPFFLMRVDPASLVTVDPTATTVVTNPALPGVSLSVEPGSTTATELSVSELPRDLRPASVPPSILPCQVVKVLPFGATFSPAASLTLPNPDNLPAGSSVDLWGLDPATGAFRVLGQGSVDSATVITAASLVTEATYLFAVPRAPGAAATDDENAFNKTPTALADGNLSTSITLPSYRSLGQDRALSFVYNSTAADPRPIVAAEVTFPALTGLPPLIVGRLEVGGIEVAGPVFMDTTVPDPRNGVGDPALVAGDTIRQAISFDASQFPTGSYPYKYTATGNFGCSEVSATASGSVLINNQGASPFGAGWSLAGLQSLTLLPDGSVVINEGDGSQKRFDAPEPEVLLEDDFNTENGGIGIFNYFGLQNWEVVSGAVDLIGNGFSDLQPGNGLYIDGDGTTGLSGRMESLLSFPLRGDYELSYRLAGNLRGSGNDTVQVGLGTAYQETFVLPDSQPFQTITREIQVALETEAKLAFQFFGNDFRGALLDDVKLLRTGPDLFLASPRGDFSSFARNADGSFTRRLKDGTTIEFDAQGRQTARTDRNDNTTRWLYDATTGRLAKIADPTSDPANPDPPCASQGVICFDYNAQGLLSVVIQPDGRQTIQEYDAQGNRTAVTQVDNSQRRYAYDQNKRLINEVSARGFVTTQNYGAAGKWTGSGFPDGASITNQIAKDLGLADLGIGIGGAGNPLPYARPNETVKLEDGKGNPYSMKFNEFSSPVEITDPIGRTTLLERDADDQVTAVVRPNDGELPDGTVPLTVRTEIDYDARGNVTAQREAFGTTLQRQTRFFYEAVFNNVIKIADATTDPNDPDPLCGTTGVTCFVYDANGNLERTTSFVDGLAFESRFSTYDARGLETLRRDAEGNTTSFAYNLFGNLEKITDAELNEATFEFDTAGNVAARTEGLVGGLPTPETRTTSFTYDAMNRVSIRTDGAGAETKFRRDAAGNAAEAIDATGRITGFAYDEQDRRIQIDDPVRGVINWTYDLNGNIETITDPFERNLQYTYDPLDRLKKTINSLQNERLFTYDAQNNLKSIRDARLNTTTFDYDILGRNVQRTNPLNETWTFEYDPRDNLERTVDAKSQEILRGYDALQRLTTITTKRADGTTQDSITFTYDKNGNQLTGNDSDSSLAFSYDKLNRAKSTESVADPGTVQPATVLTSTFDGVGNRTELRHGPDAGTVDAVTSINYDAAGRFIGILSPANDNVELSYDETGRLKQISFNNNTVTSNFLYDFEGRLDRLSHSRGLTELISFSYAYDAAGNIKSIVEPSNTRNFLYDELEQLTSGGTIASPESYSYDPEGNRLASHLSVSYEHDAANRQRQDDAFCYNYDPNGNMETRTVKVAGTCTGPMTTYTWDVLNKLIRIDFPDGRFATYRYDAYSRRIEKNFNGAITRYVYDGSDILLEFDDAGNLIARYSYGEAIDQPLVMERGGESFFYHPDHLGSVRKITNAAGTVVNSYDYDSYGRLESRLEGVRNPFTYTARELDLESGLYYYRARYYDPEAGRFLQEDPLGFKTRDTNLYRYVSNNPANLIDPFGLEEAGTYGRIAGGSAVLLFRSLRPINLTFTRALQLVAQNETVRAGVTGGLFLVFAAVVFNIDSVLMQENNEGDPEGGQEGGPESGGERTRGMPPEGLAPPVQNPEKLKEGPASRPSEREKGGKSLWDEDGGEWRYAPEDDYHNPHWDYNPHDTPNSAWDNIPIGGEPTHKSPPSKENG